MSTGVQAFVGGTPTVKIYHGELEFWFETVNKVVTDPISRINSMEKLKGFIRNLPVFLKVPAVHSVIDRGAIQRVASITYSYKWNEEQ